MLSNPEKAWKKGTLDVGLPRFWQILLTSRCTCPVCCGVLHTIMPSALSHVSRGMLCMISSSALSYIAISMIYSLCLFASREAQKEADHCFCKRQSMQVDKKSESKQRERKGTIKENQTIYT